MHKSTYEDFLVPSGRKSLCRKVCPAVYNETPGQPQRCKLLVSSKRGLVELQVNLELSCMFAALKLPL